MRALHDQQLEQYADLKPDHLKAGVLKKSESVIVESNTLLICGETADQGNSDVPVSRGRSEKEAQDEEDRGEGGG